MGDRMNVQMQVMRQLGCIKVVNGHTVPGDDFQQIAVQFSKAYQPGKSPEQIIEEIKKTN